MVKLLASSVTVLVMATVIQAQTTIKIDAKLYPTVNQIPPINSPEVIAWLKEIDLTGAPSIPLHTGDPPSCPKPAIPNEYVLGSSFRVVNTCEAKQKQEQLI